ncbi:MAG: FaeA/PapI family transcriptional regulator [Methanothrix sp.]|nr:FaeA/PapI family transcriptional regulator [Methanothrix sp.]
MLAAIMVDAMSYKERILKAIQESKDGLTTVEVARQAGVSKTTVIKYLSVLRSEGKCEYVEVGPSKLWRAVTPKKEICKRDIEPCEVESVSVKPPDDSGMVSISFRVRADQLSALLKQIQSIEGKC